MHKVEEKEMEMMHVVCLNDEHIQEDDHHPVQTVCFRM